jgi:hypothetical protein
MVDGRAADLPLGQAGLRQALEPVVVGGRSATSSTGLSNFWS